MDEEFDIRSSRSGPGSFAISLFAAVAVNLCTKVIVRKMVREEGRHLTVHRCFVEILKRAQSSCSIFSHLWAQVLSSCLPHGQSTVCAALCDTLLSVFCRSPYYSKIKSKRMTALFCVVLSEAKQHLEVLRYY